MKIYENSLEIIKNYQGFIVDVWGVIHSSGVLYPNTQNAMQKMMECGKVILLSNAPRRASKVETFLSGIGIKKGTHYHDILTSGEAFIRHAKKSQYKQVFYIGPDKDLDIFHNEEIEITQNIDDNFDDAIVSGLTDVDDISKDIPILQKLLEKNIILSCINPDIVVKVGSGHQLCAGAVAKEYEKMGGKVHYFGKPYIDVYTMVLQMFNGIPQNKILAIGDGMETDILGANNAKISSILCTTGIHEKEVFYSGIEEFLKQFQQKPDFIVNHI